jgi:hypothetical protein
MCTYLQAILITNMSTAQRRTSISGMPQILHRTKRG